MTKPDLLADPLDKLDDPARLAELDATGLMDSAPRNRTTASRGWRPSSSRRRSRW